MPGFGHRFHPVDPRRDPLLALVDGRGRGTAWSAATTCAAALAVEAALNRGGRRCR